jgi:protein kinase A
VKSKKQNNNSYKKRVVIFEMMSHKNSKTQKRKTQKRKKREKNSTTQPKSLTKESKSDSKNISECNNKDCSMCKECECDSVSDASDVEQGFKGFSEIAQEEAKYYATYDIQPKDILHTTIKNTISSKDFALFEYLGTGSFSEVVLALHLASKKFVAIKILSKKKYEKQGITEQAFSEKKLLQEIHSPFGIRLLGSFQTQLHLYLVIEYVMGMSLRKSINQSKMGLPEKLCKFYLAQVLLFLEELHNNNALYRDLKSENVLIEEYGGYIRVVDYGFATYLTTKIPQRNTVCGTLEYFCPEKLKKEWYIQSSDVWSFGVLMYEMLTGMLPFPGTRTGEILNRIRLLPLTFPEHVKPDAKKLLERIFSIAPHERPSLKDIKKHTWFQSIDWVKLKKKEVPLPFISKLPKKKDGSPKEHIQKPKSPKRDEKVQENIWDRW